MERRIKNRFRKTNTNKRMISVLLVLLLLVSLFVMVAMPVSAGTYDGNTKVYFDLSEVSWLKDDSARIAIKLYGGGSGDLWFTDDNSDVSFLITDEGGGTYSIIPPNGTDSTGFNVFRRSSDYSEDWNSAYGDLPTAPNNCVVLQNLSNKPSDVKEHKIYGSSGGCTLKGVNEYTAGPVRGETPDLLIKATFFDYMTDKERAVGWNQGLSPINDYYADWDPVRFPFQDFNSAIADLAGKSGWQYPLYFGMLEDIPDGSTAEHFGVIFKKYNQTANTSKYLPGGPNAAVWGLVEDELVDDNLVMKGSGFTAPYFNAKWLIDNNYGTVIHTEFPMRKDTKNGLDHYIYDSYEGRDTVWFDGYCGCKNCDCGDTCEDELYLNYKAYNKEGTKNLSDYNYARGVGFLPFDRNSSNVGSNYGFGVRMDIDFNIAADGKIDGKELEFDFKGDDDLWVFIDGKLVLDMGGAHGSAEGSINFADLKAVVKSSTSVSKDNESDKEFPFAWFDNKDSLAQHAMTIFYMERGMVDSNLEFGFSFSPAETDPVETGPTGTGLPATDPEVTDPPVTDLAVTDPTATDPPVTDPEVTDPAATDLAVTDPTATDSPVTDPEVTDPAATDPPVTDPEVTDPAATDLPVTDPAVTDPEVTDPAATDLPVTDPVETVTLPAVTSQVIETTGPGTTAQPKTTVVLATTVSPKTTAAPVPAAGAKSSPLTGDYSGGMWFHVSILLISGYILIMLKKKRETKD